MVPVFLHAQTPADRLHVADSLFHAGRYTQALASYDSLLAGDQYTPSMLMKMAYINEALGEVAETQYFLSLYFNATNDASALEKMEELAASNGLEGYATTEWDRLLLTYRIYKTPALALAFALLLINGVWLWRSKGRASRPWAPFSGVVVAALITLVLIKWSAPSPASIIVHPDTYLMSGPSPGSNVVEVVDGGHKVTVLGKKDVWLKVRWHNDVVYLKKASLRPVSL